MGLVGLVVGLLGLVVAPGAAFGLASWPPAEGPAWWIAKGVSEISQEEAHNWQPFEGNLDRLEPTALTSTGGSFDGYVQPMPGVPVTYWRLSVSAAPLCREPADQYGHEFYWRCEEPDAKELELYETGGYTFASGEIVGGNPEEYVQVTGSTLNGGFDSEEMWDHEADGADLGAPKAVELFPGRVYRVSLYVSPLKNSWLENWRRAAEPGLPFARLPEIDIFTPGPPVSNAQLKREERKKAKKQKQEQRRKQREERKRTKR